MRIRRGRFPNWRPRLVDDERRFACMQSAGLLESLLFIPVDAGLRLQWSGLSYHFEVWSGILEWLRIFVRRKRI